MTIKVRITTYKGALVVDTESPEEGDGFLPNTKGRLGCLLFKTKGRLGISEEAVALLRTVRVGRDAIGDLMWFGDAKHGLTFGWIGEPRYILWPDACCGDRDYRVWERQYVPIPNDVPEAVRAAFDAPTPGQTNAKLYDWVMGG